MKAKVLLSLILLCGGLAAPSARAEDAAQPAPAAPAACELPSYLLSSEAQLPKVADAINWVQPFGIDVSSGVEQAPGVKDHHRLAALFERLRDMGRAG